MVNTNDEYKYTLQDLLKAFEEAGIKKSRSWIYRQEKKGNLRFPLSTTNIKSNMNNTGAVRVLTQNQINQIVASFMPKGSGKWEFK